MLLRLVHLDITAKIVEISSKLHHSNCYANSYLPHHNFLYIHSGHPSMAVTHWLKLYRCNSITSDVAFKLSMIGTLLIDGQFDKTLSKLKIIMFYKRIYVNYFFASIYSMLTR